MLLAAISEVDPTWECIGIESSPPDVLFSRQKGYTVIEGFLDAQNPASEITEAISSADVVSMLNVLEHIDYPSKVTDVLARHMATGAYLVIDAPRHPSLASFSNLLNPEYPTRHITPPTHIQIFTEKAMDILTSKSFDLVAQWGFGLGFTDILSNVMLTQQKTETPLYTGLMDISNPVQKTIDEHGFSDQMVWVYKKR